MSHSRRKHLRNMFDTILSSRGYDQYAADAEIYAELLDELTIETEFVFTGKRPMPGGE